MKVLSVCICVAFLIGTSFLVSTDANNMTWGSIRPGDYLLYFDDFVVNPRPTKVVTKYVVYPPKDYYTLYNVSYILVEDHKPKDGGTASLVYGGPGYRRAELVLKSVPNQGLNYTVLFFGQ